jgi:hypothetical protein
MEIARVSIALSNDLNNVVYKDNVTPVEATILRSLHGKGSINIVYIESMDKRSHNAEMERMRKGYPKSTIDKLYPGEAPKIPVRFSEIGMSEPAEIVRPSIKVETETAE